MPDEIDLGPQSLVMAQQLLFANHFVNTDIFDRKWMFTENASMMLTGLSVLINSFGHSENSVA